MTAPDRNIEAVYPLTPVQEGILFHTLYAPESPLYFQQYTCLIEGQLDTALFRRSWAHVIGRHAALRSLLTWEGRSRPLQIVRGSVSPEWLVEDWRVGDPSGGPSEADDQETGLDARLDAFLDVDRARGFDLEVAPLMRFALFRTGDATQRFVWSHHHVVIDGWSMGIVLDEVFTAYDALRSGTEPDLPPAPPLGDYVAWVDGRTDTGAESHWRSLLDGMTSATPLRIEAPDVATPWAERHAEERLVIQDAPTARLVTDARRNGVTLSTVVRAAWAVVLDRYSGDDDVVFGATVAGRPAELDGVLAMVGLFINTLPVRVRLDPDESVAALLDRLQEQQISSSPYESTPLTDVQGWSGVPPGEPLFQTVLVVENVPDASLVGSDLTRSDVRYLQRSNYPLAVLVMPGESLEIILLYDADRYDAFHIRRLKSQLETVLTALLDDPGRAVGAVPFFPEDELEELAVLWNDTATALPAGGDIAELIAQTAVRYPARTAVTSGTETVTYAQLLERADAIADRLCTLGVGPGACVAIAASRTVAAVVGIVGVLRAGGAYVPVDPDAPRSRLELLLDDTGAMALIGGDDVDAVPETPMLRLDASGTISGTSDTDRVGAAPSPGPVGPGDLAYVLYTSGSTGRPKGVAVTRANLVNSTLARTVVYPEPIEAFLLVSPLVFDSSVAGLFSTLTQGGRLVLPEPRMEQAIGELADLVAEQGVTHTLMLPTLHALWLDHAETAKLATLRRVMVAGEPCPPGLGSAHARTLPACALVNEYGPTETTVWATVHEIAPGGTGIGRPFGELPDDATMPPRDPPAAPHRRLTPRVPIGRPIANATVYILDDRDRLVPIGVPGQLHIGGAGLAQGYLGRPELTAAAFVEIAPGGAPGGGPVRIYRTGDIAAWLPNGEIDLIGRRDHQVKVRGRRIELGEIEATLEEHPAVHRAVVRLFTPDADSAGAAPPVSTPDGSGQRSAAPLLAAYAETVDPDADLERFLADRLPAVMVPAVVIRMEALPTGPTGKIDRAALERPAVTSPAATTGESSLSPTESALAAIWADVLGLESVGVDDNFFELGGDSILSIRIIARANEAGLSITPRQFFSRPTVGELAALNTD